MMLFQIIQNEFFALQEEYIKTIDPRSVFCKEKNPTLALKSAKKIICLKLSFQLEELDWAFGTMGNTDKAKHLLL
jgi:hypothetical protein